MPRGSTHAMVLALVPGEWNYLGHTDEVARARLHRSVREESLDFFAHERLLLEQRVRNAVERRAVLRQQADGLGVGLVGEARLLAVTQALRLLRQRVVVGAHRP